MIPDIHRKIIFLGGASWKGTPNTFLIIIQHTIISGPNRKKKTALIVDRNVPIYGFRLIG